MRIRVNINGKDYEAEKGETILQLCKRNRINIPTLCHSDALQGLGSCRLCIVEVIQNNWSKVVTSCVFPITREIEILTHSEKIKRLRSNIIKLLYERTPTSEEINKLREEYGIPKVENNVGSDDDLEDKCILCGLCVKACDKLGTGAISTVNRGIEKKVSTPYDKASVDCIGCGSCARVCPTGAIELIEKDGVRKIWGKSFDLLQCSVCGSYFSSKEEYEYAGGVSSEAICEKCRKKSNADKLKDIYKDIDVYL
ncbi:2Fe-2S iron-sulfur cluster-binding protein [Clostridium sediminicola]|uniref:2Fe-2S iron-sulfur cluster-binding protein n=1 Tax=Clostridium sediminicola TaxID=3114879 RepID=UPI0031F24DBA